MTLADYATEENKFLGTRYIAKITDPKEIAMISETTGITGPWVKYTNQRLSHYLAHHIPGTDALLDKGIEPRYHRDNMFVIVR